ncbi:MAG TPA: DUF362 domain-containing protein [Dehalococcoidales bacterium]|nr:DUF362 domain-containing protein [Dehalococcoidales bacterium]
MAKSRVALITCADYTPEKVYAALQKGFDLLGGIGSLVKPGEKIVLKPNVLIGTDPARCVTTHPAVLRAAGQLFQRAGAEVFYGDSPAVGGCDLNLRLAGLKKVGDEAGFKVADFDHGREVSHPQALLAKKFTLAHGVLEADGLVTLPKLKAHPLARLTGAVKNQFGCVPGLLKGQFHAKMPDPYDFAAMLVDINTFIRPRFCIMDAVLAMEGNGPRSGQPRQVGALLLSTDPVALDSVAAKLINLDPELVTTSAPGEKAGLGTYHYENIDILGDAVEPLIVRDFDVVRKPMPHAVSGRLRTWIKNSGTPRPIIDLASCNACGTCIKMCPVGARALDWMQTDNGRKPKYNYSHCIRCYCCQETCPQGAIHVRTPWLGRVVFRA